jgi:hypothetical protein
VSFPVVVVMAQRLEVGGVVVFFVAINVVYSQLARVTDNEVAAFMPLTVVLLVHNPWTFYLVLYHTVLGIAAPVG